jgi:transcription elongation factor Elf1
MFHQQNCGHQHKAQCGCGRHHSAHCGCGSHFERRFQTKGEMVNALKKYLDSLQKEAQAVQERIAELGEA